MTESTVWNLTEEGNLLCEEGSYEAKVFDAVPAGGIPQSELQVAGEHGIILSNRV